MPHPCYLPTNSELSQHGHDISIGIAFGNIWAEYADFRVTTKLKVSQFLWVGAGKKEKQVDRFTSAHDTPTPVAGLAFGKPGCYSMDTKTR
jgi:hypothetical protein